MTVDYTHILSFDPIIYRRKQSDSTPSLAYGVKMPGHSCDCGAYWSDHPLLCRGNRPIGYLDLSSVWSKSYGSEKVHVNYSVL